MAFDATFDLSSFNGSNGFVVTGTEISDSPGQSVSSAGDVNGDGIDDLIIGALFAASDGETQTGRSYVVFGSSGSVGPSLDLASLDGTNGFTINGIDENDFLGWSVSSAGDVNGDGIDDLVVGAPGADPNGNSGAGESYVVFGSTNGFDPSLDLASLDGTNGFVINGINFGDRSGEAVSSAGDVNGDGIADLIIGASFAAPNGNTQAGESYVVFGTSGGFGSSLDLASLDGTNGFVINGIDFGDRSGEAVSGAGDINGDGVDDIIIGASGADPNGNNGAGESYVVFGSSNSFDPTLNLASLDGSNGFVINGIDASDNSGAAVSGLGDVNGDGVDDIIIGASWADPNGNDGAGESYVVFGNSSGFAASLDLADLNGTNGFVINGIDENDDSGRSVSGAGDVNGDGLADIIIGAAFANSDGSSSAGESYVVFGSSSGFASSLDLSNLNGANGVIIEGTEIGEGLGRSVSGAGDVNGDGIDDLIIEAFRVDLNDNTTSNTNGGSYVVFGQPSNDSTPDDPTPNGPTPSGPMPSEPGSIIILTPNSDTFTGTETTDIVRGRAGDDLLSGLGGDDAISGNGGNDIILGGQGDDTLLGGFGNDNLNGGSGNDVVKGNIGDDRVAGAAGDDRLLGNRGSDRILGGAGNDVIVGGLGSDHITTGAGSDVLVYRGINDRSDQVTDFTVGDDVLDISLLLQRNGIQGDASVLDDVVRIGQGDGGTIITFDPDGSDGGGDGVTLVTLMAVNPSDVDASSFVFA